MSSSQIEPTASDSPKGAADVTGERVYGPKRRPWAIIVGLLLGFVLVWSPLAHLVAWSRGGPFPDRGEIYSGMLGIVWFGLILRTVIAAFRGRPRLILDRLGIRFSGIYGTKWAEWGSIGSFGETKQYIGFLTKRSVAMADVVGSAVSENWKRRKVISLPDAFDTSISRVVADLNAFRSQYAGAPPVSPVPVGGGSSFGLVNFKAPWLTFAILVILIAVFIGEQKFALAHTGPLLNPDVRSILAFGGLNRTLVFENGEWSRLLTAPFLHADFNHILLNGIALVIVGYLLERLVGRVWFLAYFVIGAIGGSVMSLAINSAKVTSMGASGAIMGLFAATFILSYRLPEKSSESSRLRMRSLWVLIPSLLPIVTSKSGTQIDYAAHFGGALSCAAVAFLVLKKWPETSRLPPLRRVATSVVALGLVLVGGSTAAVAHRYPQYRMLTSLIPLNQIPRTADAIKANARNIAARYPNDPRSHMYLAIVLSQAKDNSGAERELRIALRKSEDLESVLGAQVTSLVRGLLAQVLLDEGKRAEAKVMAREICRTPPDQKPFDKMRKTFAIAKLCD